MAAKALPSPDELRKARGRRMKDLTGERIEMLTIVGPVDRASNGDVIWHAECDCGGSIRDRAYNLRKYKGCGCQRANAGLRSMRHGHARHSGRRSPTYESWLAMRRRCGNPGHHKWKRYGGAGVVIADRWSAFENFLADMGTRPDGKTLDRIDPYGNYEPGNCRWATPLEQRHNRREQQ